VEYKSSVNSTFQNFGIYSGSNVNNVEVSIPGPVTEIRVTLSDELGGSGELSVGLSSVSSCSDPVSALISDKKENSKSISEPLIAAFPNPFEESVILNVSNISPQNPGRIVIIDNYGRQIYEINETEINSMRKRINTSQWASGLYYIHYTNGEIQKSELLVKIK